MIDADHEVPLEPGQELSFYHGLNATISFEFEPDDRMDVYTSTPAGLVRVDQLGWSQILVLPGLLSRARARRHRTAGGWDWATSGGDVNLFYEQCNLEGVPTAVFRTRTRRRSRWAPSPNPAHGEVSLEIVVGGGRKPMLAKVGISMSRAVSCATWGRASTPRAATAWSGTARTRRGDTHPASTSPAS
jgi:hypothetical protein